MGGGAVNIYLLDHCISFSQILAISCNFVFYQPQYLLKMGSDEKINMSDDKSAPVYDGKGGVHDSASDAEVGSGRVEVVETTKRGLKARHAQMIALGGTIGTSPHSVGRWSTLTLL